MNNEQYLRVAIKAAKKAGPIFKKYFGNAGQVETKGGNHRNLVTKVDRKIELLIRKKISTKFPTHKIVGEEFKNELFSKHDLVWFVDPIDGTANFIYGFPFCCISIALWNKDGPVIGVVFNPILDEIYWATKNNGAYLNGKRISISKETDISRAYGGYGWGRKVAVAQKYFPRLVKNLNKIRAIGTTASEVALVAKGVYDFHIQAEIKIWDFAAAALILTEAGGKITDWEGNPISVKTKKLAASNGKIHKELLKVIR